VKVEKLGVAKAHGLVQVWVDEMVPVLEYKLEIAKAYV